MVVMVLYLIGGEMIKYFAFALIVGVLVGTYSSIYVASPLMAALEVRAQARAVK
jgi:preprotein translocase subunit SecF